MEYIKTLLMLSLCAGGFAGESLSDALQRRRDAHPVYARQYAEDYEPYAYAAIPLHAPMPIVHLLSPTPINKYIQNHKQRNRPPADRDLEAYGSTQTEEYEPYDYNNYAYSPNSHKYSNSLSNEEESQPVVIYARPNKNGGYTYRKRPSSVTQTPRPKREPIVFRIHKYKIIKDLRK
ncbi:uncharacterized protein LOC123697157 [Colias croceus]|uniref:uncharacterized protein LOC123697157 n=1 Tax=Colias crocea TaxID=72248 RepID=UPI001E27B66A|nr:uncharacterized protein LOC123697157 [Colias croceus]